MQILSSLSGIQFSAASAGYAPTNSADVSAIASAYATGIGSSEASAIASAYVESGVSSKLDTTAQVVTSFESATTSVFDVPYTFVNRINGLGLSAQIVDLAEHAQTADFANTCFDWTHASGKQDVLTFAYDADSAISSINGSALAGGGGGGGGVDSATVSAIASSYAESAASGKLDSTAFNSADFYSTANESGFVDSAYVDSAVSGKQDELTFAYDADSAISSINGSALAGGGGGGGVPPSTSADENKVLTIDSAGDPGWVMPKNAFLATYGTTTWVEIYNAHNAGRPVYLYRTGDFGVAGLSVPLKTVFFSNSPTNSYALFTSPLETAESFNTKYFVQYRVDRNNSWTSGSNAVTHAPDVSASNAGRFLKSYYNGVYDHGMYWATVRDVPSSTTSDEGKVLTVNSNGSAAWSAAGGGGGVDSATVSAIASSYAESAASGKLDTTAFNSADFYSTSNPSGFVTGVDLSQYQPTSAMTSYATTAYVESGLSVKENVFSAGTGLEFVQSGSGRVLQVNIVAGNGVRVVADTANNRWVVEADETVLYDCSNNYVYGTNSVTLSESYKNFEVIKILNSKGNVQFYYPGNSQNVAVFALTNMTTDYFWLIPWTFTSNTVYSGSTGKMWTVGSTTVVDVPSNAPFTRWIQPIKIIGVGRIAGN